MLLIDAFFGGASRRVATLALVAALIAFGCSSDDSGDGTNGKDGDGGTPVGDVSGALESGEPQELDCERDGYPCSWAEADDGAAERTDQLLAMSSLLLTQGATAGELAARLEAAPDVAQVLHDPISVWFRVEGAAPVFVHVDPPGLGDIEGAVPPIEGPARGSAPAPSQAFPLFTGCGAPGEDRADGQRGPVGKTGEPKKALILGPWRWQMEWDTDTLVSKLKLNNSDYEKPGGGVETVMTTQDQPSAFDGSVVTLESFCNWAQYDTVMLKTHGRSVCDGETRCYTSLSVGRFAETEAVLRAYAGGATGVTFSTSRYGNLDSSLTSEQADACIAALEIVQDTPTANACLESLPSAGHMEVTTDFFRANYGGGLKDRMIFFSACQGMKQGDLARALRGTGESSGVILGFDKIIQTVISNRVLDKFAEWVATGRAIDQDALDELNRLVDNYQGGADVTGAIEGTITIEEIADVVPDGSEVTRGADIVSLHEEPGGEEFRDGMRLELEGFAGDGVPDEVKLGVRLTGVGEEGPDAYPIQIFLGDERALFDEDELQWVESETEGVYDSELKVLLIADLENGVPISLEIRTVLPDAEGAISRWKYEDLQVGAPMGATIRVGDETWEFELVGFFGSGCSFSEDGSRLQVAGKVDDAYSVSFSADLFPGGEDVRGLFSVHGITVDDDVNGREFMADELEFPMSKPLESIPPGGSQIDSLTIEDDRAWGTATFIDVQALRDAWLNNGPMPGSVSGEFDIRCGG